MHHHQYEEDTFNCTIHPKVNPVKHTRLSYQEEEAKLLTQKRCDIKTQLRPELTQA